MKTNEQHINNTCQCEYCQLTQQCNIISYTLWGVIHKLPIKVIKRMVMESMIEEDVEMDTFECFKVDQDWKDYLHEFLFFNEVRNQGLDEEEWGPDFLFDYYEETWRNL